LSGWPSASKDSKENRLECSFDGAEIRIDRCENGSGVNRMIAYRSIKLNANDNFAPVAIAA